MAATKYWLATAWAGCSSLQRYSARPAVVAEAERHLAIATRLATDDAWRRALSTTIRERIETSGIADLERYTRNLEEAYARAAGIDSQLSH
jgi:predicted O-linked N-acetylglucosamine transferase (SPINDLY family)